MEFSPLPIHRMRKKKRLSSEKVEGNPITDPTYKFKIKTYFVSLDIIITALNNKFTSKSKNLLKDDSLFSTKILNEIKFSNNSLPIDALNTFYDIYTKFVQLDDLKKEYVQFANYFSEFSNVMNLPTNLYGCSKKVCDEDKILDGSENAKTDDSYSNDRTDYNNESTHFGS